ncbi:MAG: helix-turn-helix domain-containing protein [Synergistales bacterium]|nr:helix-turn-helix domain-containing protein [Synergistales bacterium]
MRESFDEFDSAASERDDIHGEVSLQSLGAIVKEEREAKGLTIDYMADKTKIRQAYLIGIESGAMEGFHGNVYKRGFVKCYLESLDMIDLWPYYDGLLKDGPSKVDLDATPPLGDFTPPTKGFRKGSRKTVFALLLAVIAASGWYIWSNRDVLKTEVVRIQEEQMEMAQKAKEQKAKEEQERLEAEAAEAARLAVSQDSSVVAAVPALSEIVTSGDEGKPVLSVTALKDSWVRITREGERIFGGTLKVGQDMKVEATGRIHVIYGRPETLKVAWNGAEIDPSKEGPGPVHFLYSSDGKYSVISAQDAEALWAQTPISGDLMPEEEPVAEVKAGPAVMIIKATKGDCWLKATSGNKTHYAGTLKKGSEASMDLSSPVHVVFGNPSAVSVFVDGKDVGYAGTPGQVARTIYGTDGSVKAAPKQ